MDNKKSSPLILWQGVACLLLCCFSFLLVVPLISRTPLATSVLRMINLPIWFGLAASATLALGILTLLNAGKAAHSAKWPQRIFGILCILEALVLAMNIVYYRPLYLMARAPWRFLSISGDLFVGLLSVGLWLLLALDAAIWMLLSRSRLNQVGRVFCWGVIIGGLAYCITGLVAAVLPYTDAANANWTMGEAMRGASKMRAMGGAFLAPLAMVLLFGGSAAKEPTISEKAEAGGQASIAAPFMAPRGFVILSIIVAIINSLGFLTLGWLIEYTSLFTVLGTIAIMLSYALMLRGRKAGFWLLLVFAAGTAALNFLFFTTGPMALAGLLNPVLCWLLLHKSWSDMR